MAERGRAPLRKARPRIKDRPQDLDLASLRLRDGDMCRRMPRPADGTRPRNEINEEIMKTKAMVVLFTMLFAMAMMAQTATPAAPAAPAAGDKAGACACCGHDMANMKAGAKCPMMKDGKMADG